MGWLRAKIRNHFGFSKRETNGTLVLIFLMVAALAIPAFLQFQPLSPEEVEQLNQQLQVLQSKPKPSLRKKSTKISVTKEPKKAFISRKRLDINQATKADLMTIKGIGPTFAKRILKYRKLLGGYISPQQYHEVYGLSEGVLKRIKNRSYIHPEFKPTTIPINSASYKTMIRHPYLSPPQVKNIMAYRNQHGHFISLTDVEKLALLNQKDLSRLSPYLDYSFCTKR